MSATQYAALVSIAATAVAISSRSPVTLWPAALQRVLDDNFGVVSACKIHASITTLIVAALGFLGLSIKGKFKVMKPKAPPTPLKGTAAESIVLYDFPSLPGVASVSHSVSKIHAFLAFAKLPYTTKSTSPDTGPKGKLPYIQHGQNTVPDSVFIMAYLRNTYGKGQSSGILAPMDAGKRARVDSCMALVEQTLPYAVGYYRVIDPQGFRTLPSLMNKLGVPRLLCGLIAATMRSQVSKLLYLVGLGRHCRQDFDWLLQRDLTALSALLGSQVYLFGDEPTDADAVLFANLDVILHDGHMSPALVDQVKQHDNLVRYTAHIRKTFFADKLKEQAALRRG
ncbi:hypothetical protein WJX73_007215 [Symbiochloris irregularis]|uniref:Glutathione S-transferase n=1 Tax=Symbiochloris irregularis TaxID=706552 RepID=A0AAW1NV15_9CHLO